MFPFSSLKKNTDSLLAAAAGFAIILLFTKHSGIGVSPDSVVYMTTAENLRTHGKLIDFTKRALIDFPAFYSVFLSTIMLLTTLKPLLFAPFLNALLFAFIIYLSGMIMENFSIKSSWYKRAILVCILLSPALLEVYSMLWSETLFILWILLFIRILHHYFKSYSRKALIAAAFIAALASVTRYAGVTIIATGGLLLLFDLKNSFRRKASDMLIFLTISPVLLIINLVRNHIAGGTLTGVREKSLQSLAKNIGDTGSVFADWFPFLKEHSTISGWIPVLLIVALLWICLRVFVKYGRVITYTGMSAAFTMIYLAFMIITASIFRFEELNSRFLSPAFITLLWSISIWLIYLIKKSELVIKIGLIILSAFIFLSFQYKQIVTDYQTWQDVKDDGIPGYTEDSWKFSPTVQFIRNDSLPFKKNYTIYSNAYDAVYYFTGRPGKFLPHKEFHKDVQDFLDDRHCYVVWFNDDDDPDRVELDFITNIKKMKLIKQFDDGALYEFDGPNDKNSR